MLTEQKSGHSIKKKEHRKSDIIALDQINQ